MGFITRPRFHLLYLEELKGVLNDSAVLVLCAQRDWTRDAEGLAVTSRSDGCCRTRPALRHFELAILTEAERGESKVSGPRSEPRWRRCPARKSCIWRVSTRLTIFLVFRKVFPPPFFFFRRSHLPEPPSPPGCRPVQGPSPAVPTDPTWPVSRDRRKRHCTRTVVDVPFSSHEEQRARKGASKLGSIPDANWAGGSQQGIQTSNLLGGSVREADVLRAGAHFEPVNCGIRLVKLCFEMATLSVCACVCVRACR